MDNNTTIPKKGTYEYLEYITKKHEASQASNASGSKKKKSGLGKLKLSAVPKMSASEKLLAKFEKNDMASKMKKNGTNIVTESFKSAFGR